ncbi:FtsX-like permease family protein [Amycolatopsis sp. lyj-23]|uniref:FtsX-like permease family protein n=1 Tax=Amycolatopsis sp. lyj-23 TaxID=2789283 RepID=UPI003979D03A
MVSDARNVDAGRVTLAVAAQNGPVDHTVTAPAFTLPHRPHAPIALLTATTATALGLGTIPFTVAATTSRMPTADEQDRLQARLGQEFEVRVDRGTQQDGQPLMVLAIVAGVVTLAAAALATGLAAADGRADLATLAALGASPRMRRALSLSQAGVIAGLGSVLGTLAGVGTAIAVLTSLNQATADVWPVQQPLPIIVPWLNIGTALVVVPVIAMLGAGLLTRSRLPIER